ncbi:MAG: hypothetical protein WCK47_11585 [bacterium]|nr:hypothetical protein [Candidatus Sumerlaeota bacterium]
MSHNLLAITALGASLRLLLDAGMDFVSARASFAYIARMLILLPRKTMLMNDHRIVVAAWRGFLRVSPHFYNDEDEIARLIAALQ